VLDIADDIWYDIFTEWVKIADVCRLDSALCHKGRRPAFLKLISLKVLLFNREEINVLEGASFTHSALREASPKWILKRGIHLASLHLPASYRTIGADLKIIHDAVSSLVHSGSLDKLEMVSLFRCQYIDDTDLAAILSKCYGSVKSIDIRGCGLIESSAVHIKRCTKLEAFSTNGNESVADLAEIFQACPRLRMVDLSAFASRLTDEVVLSVVARFRLLEHLDLGIYSAVSDTAMRKVAESCPLLQCVKLTHTVITDATVVSFCYHCPLLKLVYLGACELLTDTAVLAVAERLPGLKHIDLQFNGTITSGAVETLASRCRELACIDLSYCPNISDATLTKIVEHCPRLEELRVDFCPNVTAAGEAEIRSQCPKLILSRLAYFEDESESVEDESGEEELEYESEEEEQI
jgi:hypothetical protein